MGCATLPRIARTHSSRESVRARGAGYLAAASVRAGESLRWRARPDVATPDDPGPTNARRLTLHVEGLQ